MQDSLLIVLFLVCEILAAQPFYAVPTDKFIAAGLAFFAASLVF